MKIRVIGPGHNFGKADCRYVESKLMLEKGRSYSGKDISDSCILIQPQILDKKGEYSDMHNSAFLLDAGYESITSYFQLLRHGEIKPANMILISHNHGDHSGGLSYLLCDNPQKETGTVVFGPRGEEVDLFDTRTQGIENLAYLNLRTANEVGREGNKIKVYEVSDQGLLRNSNINRDQATYKEGLKLDGELRKSRRGGYILLDNCGLRVEAAFGERHSTSKEWVLAYSLSERSLNLDYQHTKDPVKREAIKNIQNILRTNANSIHSIEDLSKRVSQSFDKKVKNKKSFNFQNNTPEFLFSVWKTLFEQSVFSVVENKVTYITDTSITDASSKNRLVNLAQGSDVLICGTPNLKANGSDHLSIEDAVMIAEEVQPKKLVITHLGAYMRAGLFLAQYPSQEPTTKKLKEKYNELVKIEKELEKKGVELIIAEADLGITSQNELQILE